MQKVRTVKEVGGFLKKRKKYWLAPLIISLILIGIIVVVGESSALGPLVYPFF